MYDSPGGKIKPGESLIDGIQREIYEETEIDIFANDLDKNLSMFMSYSSNSSDEYRFKETSPNDDFYKLTHMVYIYPFPKNTVARCTEYDKHGEWKFYSEDESRNMNLVSLLKTYFKIIFYNIRDELKERNFIVTC